MVNKTAFGLPTLVALVIANMIGAGAFTTSGFALGDLGSPELVIVAWIAGGTLAICGALSYGALARLMPISGGEYLFLSRAMHPMAGFVAGWVSLLAGFTGAIAFSAITLGAYLVPDATDRDRTVVASAAIVIAALAHSFRVQGGTFMQNAAVALKLVLIGSFIVYGLIGLDVTSWHGINHATANEPVVTQFSVVTFATTLMWISFSYSGFNAAIYVSSEVENASRIVPRAMVYATLITTIIYVALNAIFVYAPEFEAVAFKEDVAAIAAHALGGEPLTNAVRILMAIALMTSISAMVMIGPRVYAQMAEDGLMPSALRFGKNTPGIAIAVQSVLAIVVVWATGLRELLSYLGFTLGLSAAATVASLFVVVRRSPEAAADLRGYPWAPAIFIVFTLLFAGLAATRNPWEMVAAAATILTGVGLYYVAQWRASRSGRSISA